jgi:hypothetical protein
MSRDLKEGSSYLTQWNKEGDLVPVPPGHVIAAAEKVGCSIGEAARRLSQLGFLVPPDLAHLDAPHPRDRVLASRDLTGDWPWLSDRVAPLGHILTAAQRLVCAPETVAWRLMELGFEVPQVPHGPVRSDEISLMSRELAPLPPPEQLHTRRHGEKGWWLDQEEPVPLWNLVAGAVQTEESIAWVAERMRSFGFTVPDVSDLPEPPGSVDGRSGGPG